MDRQPPPADMTLRRSGRDPARLADRIAGWLATVLPGEMADPRVVAHGALDTTGMSSETIFIDVTWSENGRPRTGRYVARAAPAAEDVPVFPEYALRHQYETMRLVGELTGVPVPRVRWAEPTGEVLGTPFFLMDRVEGEVPPDVLPYNFGGNWLFDAAPEDQRRVQDGTVRAVAGLHAIPDARSAFGFLAPGLDAAGGRPLAAGLAHTRAWYDFAVADLERSPLAERGLAWLQANLPETRETVLCWGDARIGNVLFRGFEPVAVLDWEMATLGPRELDVSWMIFAHQVFESITKAMGMPGMPHFLREEDVTATYEELTGATLGDLRWYHVYNGVRWAIVFMRTGTRQIRFGEIERPGDIETLMHHRPLLARILDEVGA